MLSRDEEPTQETPVTLADQSRINTFSTLHSRHSLLLHSLQTLHTEKEYLTDAISELELSDDDDIVPYKIGDAFVDLKVEEVRELLEAEVEGVDGEVEGIEGKVRTAEEEMGKLKVELYAKFGKSINLEA